MKEQHVLVKSHDKSIIKVVTNNSNMARGFYTTYSEIRGHRTHYIKILQIMPAGNNNVIWVKEIINRLYKFLSINSFKCSNIKHD